MAKWDKMDRMVWNKSEVMNEFETLLTRSALLLQKKIEAQQAQEISNKLDRVNQSVETASKGMSDFLEKAKNLAEDDSEDVSEEVGPTEEEQAEARAMLLAELNQMIVQATENKDYKLAYKIERTIDSIIFGE